MLDFTKIPNWPQRQDTSLWTDKEAIGNAKMCADVIDLCETALTSLVEEGKFGRVLSEGELIIIMDDLVDNNEDIQTIASIIVEKQKQMRI